MNRELGRFGVSKSKWSEAQPTGDEISNSQGVSTSGCFQIYTLFFCGDHFNFKGFVWEMMGVHLGKNGARKLSGPMSMTCLLLKKEELGFLV